MPMMYHVGPISLITLLTYLITLFFVANGFIQKSLHRRIWNWVLLFTFFTTALLGVFMALQINYKWNIPIIKQMLHWHVEFGTGMACTALIHFSWHLKYYFSRKDKDKGDNNGVMSVKVQDRNAKRTGILLFLTGFASSATQFILLREAMIMGGGTEISAGLFLWFWLIISALGALAGGARGSSDKRKLMWALISGLLLSFVLYFISHSIILKPGEIPGFIEILIIIVITVAPAAFATSFAFIRLTTIRQNEGFNVPGNSFGLETAGSVAAGLLTTASVSIFIANFQIYLIVLIISSVVTLTIFPMTVRRRVASLIFGLVCVLAVLILRPDTILRGILLRSVVVERSFDTPYGNITTGTSAGEAAIYYDHRPVLFPDDVARTEENIHYALLQRMSNDTILIISGGIEKHLEEVMKYNPAEVTYLEYDPGMLSAEGAKNIITDSGGVIIRKDDPLKHFRNNKKRYNAIIQLTPPPTTLSVNRFFTTEYFTMVKEHLVSGGVFLSTPMPYYNYSPESYRKSFSSVFTSLNSVFKNVLLIPGTSLYAVASDSSLKAGITELVRERGIENHYVCSDYLNDTEIKSRGEQILSGLDHEAQPNTMMKPVSSWFSNSLSLEMRGAGSAIILIIMVLVAVPFLMIRSGGITMFSVSAGLSGYGMIIICLLQSFLGNMYLLSALVLSVLMTGLAAGASGSLFRLKKAQLWLPLLLAVVYFLTGVAVQGVSELSPTIVILIFFTLLLLSGYLTGALFRELTSVQGRSCITRSVYASDLAGAALGYMTVSVILVPLAGITLTSFILSAFILITVALVSIAIKH